MPLSCAEAGYYKCFDTALDALPAAALRGDKVGRDLGQKNLNAADSHEREEDRDASQARDGEFMDMMITARLNRPAVLQSKLLDKPRDHSKADNRENEG
jgi:hypothetical protein